MCVFVNVCAYVCVMHTEISIYINILFIDDPESVLENMDRKYNYGNRVYWVLSEGPFLCTRFLIPITDPTGINTKHDIAKT